MFPRIRSLFIHHRGSLHIAPGLSHIGLTPDIRPFRIRLWSLIRDWWWYG